MNNKNQKTGLIASGAKKWLIPLIVLLAGMPSAHADKGDVTSINIDITGTVVANGSCTFNQGGELKVDFKEVTLKGTGNNTVQLEGEYVKKLTSDFFCSGDTAGLLQMKLSSSTDSYETYSGTQVLGTNSGIVGVQLLVNGAPQNMGEWFTVDQNTMPTLQAKLVQVSTVNSNNVASGDVFTASGTLTLAFN